MEVCHNRYEHFLRSLRSLLFRLERSVYAGKGGENPYYHMHGCSREELRVYRCIFSVNRFLHLLDIFLLAVCIAVLHVGKWTVLKQCCAVLCAVMIPAQIPCILLQKQNFLRLDRAERARAQHERHLVSVLTETMASAIPEDESAELRRADADTAGYHLERFRNGKTVILRPMDLHFLERLNVLLFSVEAQLLAQAEKSTPAGLPNGRYRRMAEELYGRKWPPEHYGNIEIHDPRCEELWQQLAGKLPPETLEAALLSAENAWRR